MRFFQYPISNTQYPTSKWCRYSFRSFAAHTVCPPVPGGRNEEPKTPLESTGYPPLRRYGEHSRWIYLIVRCFILSLGLLLQSCSKKDTSTPHGTLWLRADQVAQKAFIKDDYKKAADNCIDPMRKGVALYKAGEFKEAAAQFAAIDTPEGTFNHGNALLFQGQYEKAVKRYARALELRPDWPPAMTNIVIARTRAEMLKKEGGNMSEGKLRGDGFIFDKGKSKSEGIKETTEGGQQQSEAELRAVWLRQVQTKPADFLKLRFAYQLAKEDDGRKD